MPDFIERPTVIEAAGNVPKVIEEYVGRVNSDETRLSIARMRSPQGWREPGQRPEFDEYTIVIDGTLDIEFEGGRREVTAGSAVLVRAGEWVRYSSPSEGGAHYIAVCLPAFSIETVQRDES